MSEERKLDRLGLLNLAVVYLIWGSTYLAIRIAVREGAGFPPFFMALMRVAAASTILLLWAKFKGHRLKLKRQELAQRQRGCTPFGKVATLWMPSFLMMELCI